MALNMVGKMTGAADSIKKMADKASNGERFVIEAVEKSALLVVATAKKMCPVDEGRLRASISHEMVIEKGKEIVARVGTNVSYAPFVEFGTGIHAADGSGRKDKWRYYYAGKKGESGFRWTHGNKAKPFLYPALKEKQREITRIIAEAVKRALK